MTESTHARRIVPIILSAKQFYHCEPGAIGLSRMPMAQSADGGRTVDRIAVADQVPWCRFSPRKCFGDLLRNPFRCRVAGDIDPDQLCSVMTFL